VMAGVDMAMRLMSRQFVQGETIEAALANAQGHEEQGFRFSYDMLGEAAMTAADAARYADAYTGAIECIGDALSRDARRQSLDERPGVSIKLSALHPRYDRAQRERVMQELFPRLLFLAKAARARN